jgi:hypothetical protein
VIRAIFDKTLNYKDSLFYDITSWTMPLAFGLNYAELDATTANTNLLGVAITETPVASVPTLQRSSIAYLLPWTELLAPAALNELLTAGVITKVASNPLSVMMNNREKKFSYGTIMIPVQIQNINADRLYDLVKNISQKYKLEFFPVTTGTAGSGSDLGSRRFLSVTKPVIATVVGQGVNATDAGELWHLMDQRFNIPMSQLETSTFNRADLSKYNTLVLVGGSYADLNKEKLSAWVQNGGCLVLMEEAVTWAIKNGITSIAIKKVSAGADSTTRLNYSDKEQIEGAQQMRGAIFRAEADLSHPLAYGYTQPYIYLFKGNKVFMEKSKNPYQNPFYYKDKPLQSGWVSRQNLDAIKNSSAVIVTSSGSGKVISIADNPNFRAFWLGGSKLVMNAIFFGRLIDTGGATTE